MPALPPPLFNDVLSALMPHLQTDDDRRALLAPLFSALPIYQRINWAGDAHAFTVRLVELLSRAQLVEALEALPIGSEQSARIQRLRRELLAEASDPPDPGESPFEVNATTLRDALAARFSLSEIETLCFDLGIDDEDVPGTTKSEKARELVRYMERRGRLSDLIAAIRKARPNVI